MARANIALQFIQDLTGLRATDAAVGRTTKGIQAMNRVAGRFALLLGGAAMGRMARGFVQAVSEQETAVKRLESRLRGLGSEALASSAGFQQMAGELQRATGIGDEEILRIQAKLLTFRRIGPEIFQPLLESVLDVATVMEGGASSAALQLGKALDDPARRTSELSRAGITFTQTQQDMITALQESGQLLEAQKMVLAEVRAQYGGAARDEGKTLAKLLGELGNSWTDLQQAFAKSSGANNPLAAVIQESIDTLRLAIDFLTRFDGYWNAFMLSIDRGRLSILRWSLAFKEAMPGAQGEDRTRAAIAELSASLSSDRIPKYIKFLQRLNDEAAGVAPKIAGFGAGVAEAGEKADAAAENTERLAAAIKSVSEGAGLGSTSQFHAVLDTAYEQFLERVDAVEAIGILPLDDTVSVWAANLKEQFKEAVEEAGEESAPQFASYFEVALGRAIGNALASGDARGGLADLLDLFADDFSKKLAAAGDGIGAGMFSVIAGVMVGGLFDMMGGNAPVTNNKFLGAVDIFHAGSQLLERGAGTLRDAALEIMEAGVSIRDALAGLEGTLGSNIFGSPSLHVTEQANGQFKAAIEGLTGSFGDSIAEATRGALDELARNMAALMRMGRLDTSGLDPSIAGALGESSFANFSEMENALRNWDEALNSVAATLGAVTLGTDGTLQRLRELEIAILRSGLSAEAAAPFLGEIAQAMDIRKQQIAVGLFGDVASIMQQMGMNSQKAAAFQTKAAQIDFQLKIAEIDLTRRALNLQGVFWDTFFARATEFGANFANFAAGVAQIAAPVIRAARLPNFGGGSSLNSLGSDRERHRAWLAGLDFQSPGSPIATKTAERAAFAELQRAAGKRDSAAYQSAAGELLRITQDLYGGLGLGAARDLIRNLGDFDPKAQDNPVVNAINAGFGSMGDSLGMIDASVLSLPPDIGDEIGDVLPPPPPPAPPPVPPVTPPEMEDIMDRFRERLGDRFGRIIQTQTNELSDDLGALDGTLRSNLPRFDPRELPS